MIEQESASTIEENTADPTPTPQRAAWLIPVITLAAIVLIGMLWWSGQPNPEDPSQRTGAAALLDPAAALAESQAPATPPATATDVPPTPTATPIDTQQAAAVALPTVTPTLTPSEVPSRTLTFGGTATLRMLLQSDNFASDGSPIDRTIEPRIYALSSATPAIADHWCMQMGLVNLVFDITFTLNPVNGTVKTAGTLGLYDGFCDAPGPLRTSVTLDVEVPADATAQLVQSLQTEAHLLEFADLLDIDTGVFVALGIWHPESVSAH
jgi:hypothetical protein